MLTAYRIEGHALVGRVVEPGETLPPDLLWLDLHLPSADEIKLVESQCTLRLPTEDKLREIDVASQLAIDENALFMTAIVISEADSPHPVSRGITFVLTPSHLITLRHTKPRPFQAFAETSARNAGIFTSAEMILVGLLQAIIARSADVLERLSIEIDSTSHHVFGQTRRHSARTFSNHDFRKLLREMGRRNDVTTTLQESLFSIGRLVNFPRQVPHWHHDNEFFDMLATLSNDVGWLRDQTHFLSNKIGFLLNVVLGMIDVEQNGIIRVLSVVSVVFMPATLIASVYGMNFPGMPEFEIPHAYFYTLGAIGLVSLLPVLFFLYRRWL